MKIAIGCDHGGIVLKKAVVDVLVEKGISYKDYGTYTEESCDYPDFALKVSESVALGECDKGIILCGTGIGISIAANKVKGIRAAVVFNEFTAKASKEHNNANILSLGGRIITPSEASKLVKVWLETEFAGGRHTNRINKISDIETKYMR